MASARLTIIARNFSTTTASEQLVKPPIQIFGLEGRYATALFSAATKTKQLDAVEKDLVQFQNSMKTDVKLRSFLDNPTLKRKLKAEALKQIATKIPLSPPTGNLLALLAENGRLSNLNGVINAFKTIMAAHRGEVTCEVITAKPVDDALRKDLEAALKAFTKPGQNLLMTAKVDPSIIGGMIVSIGDKYVDMSIASKIKKYQDILTTAV